MKPTEGRKRVVIEAVKPQVDCGRYAVRRFLGDRVTVSAAMFGDGHDHVTGRLLFRHAAERSWQSVPLVAEGNDIWSASFSVDKLGVWQYAVQGWVDHLGTWCADLAKRLEAQPGQKEDAIGEGGNFGADPGRPPSDIPLALRTGAALLQSAAGRAKGTETLTITAVATSLELLAEKNAASYD